MVASGQLSRGVSIAVASESCSGQFGSVGTEGMSVFKTSFASSELPTTGLAVGKIFAELAAPVDASEISREWFDEIRSRADDIDSGEVKLINGEEVLKELRAI